MADSASMGGFEFRFGPGANGGAKRDGEAPMRILVMGDFSGREGRGEVEHGVELAGRAVHAVDVEEFDGVMARLGVAVLDPLLNPEDALPIEFRSLEDFHPDRLLARVESFGRWRSIRRRLGEAAKFEGAAKELVEVLGFDPGVMVGEAGVGGGVEAASRGGVAGASDFASLLGFVGGASSGAGAASGVEAFIRSVVAPHVVKGSGGRELAYVAAADAAMSALMRRLMHSPMFKVLESNWRGVHRLVTSLELGERLSVHVLDVSRDEMIVDLAEASRAGGLVNSGLYKQLVEAAALSSDGEGWGMVVGCYTFERTVGDAVLLNGLAQLASAAGTAFLTGAGASMVGAVSFADGADPDRWLYRQDEASYAAGNAWEVLRTVEDARYVAMGMPRVLLRTPYGAGGESAETFGYEELAEGGVGEDVSVERARHEAYLWGNPAMTMAEVLGTLFLEDGWGMDAGGAAEVIGLPVHSFSEGSGGPKRVMACAEAWVTERGAHAMREAGVTPLMSIKGRDGVRVPGIVGLSKGGGAPAGRWDR